MSSDVNWLTDRAAAYGDGVFETIAIRNGEPRFWSLHGARLQTGCTRLGIACPTIVSLRDKLESAIVAADGATEYATAKLVVSAGAGPRGYRRDPNTDPIARVALFEANKLPAANYRDGIAARICSTRLAVQPQLAGIKSLNRLEQVLGRAEWDDPELFEGLMLDTNGRLICGTMSNVFIVNKNVVATPAITRCGVSGIMRQHVISLLSDAGIACDVRDIDGEELSAAAEVFLSNSQFGVLPVRQCAILHWEVGALTRKTQQLAAGNSVPECAP